MSLVGSTALSPRPEQTGSSTTIRRRLGGASPLLVSEPESRLRPVGPSDSTFGRSLTPRRTDPSQRYLEDPNGHLSHQPPIHLEGDQTPTQTYCGFVPSPQAQNIAEEMTSKPSISGPSTMGSSTFNSSRGLQPTSPNENLPEDKELPRLPTPDFARFKARPLTQALVSPLSFFREEPDCRDSGEAEKGFHQFPDKRNSMSWLGRRGGSNHLRSGQWVDMYPEANDRVHLNGSGSREWPRSITQTFLKPPVTQPPTRHPTLTSPNPNHPQKNSLVSLLPALQEVSLRFTQKIPWAASGNGRDGEFVHLADGAAVDAMGVSLNSEAGFGVERPRHWNGFKWALMITVVDVFIMGVLLLVATLHTWFGAWSCAHIVLVVEYNVLVFATLAGGTLLLTALLGFSGTLLNSRPILAFYALLLWPSFISCLTVGYTAYKRRTFDPEGKLSQGWSQYWGDHGRAIIQNTYTCCGFFAPMHDYSLSNVCYPRSSLPGCRAALSTWDSDFLKTVYIVVFGTVPLQILNIIVSLVCSNHVNRTFGKGLTPKAYRLSLADVQANAEKVMETISGTTIPYLPDRTRERKVKDLQGLGVEAPYVSGEGRSIEDYDVRSTSLSLHQRRTPVTSWM